MKTRTRTNIDASTYLHTHIHTLLRAEIQNFREGRFMDTYVRATRGARHATGGSHLGQPPDNDLLNSIPQQNIGIQNNNNDSNNPYVAHPAGNLAPNADIPVLYDETDAPDMQQQSVPGSNPNGHGHALRQLDGLNDGGAALGQRVGGFAQLGYARGSGARACVCLHI